LALVPFNAELNRLMLVVKNGAAKHYKVIWGSETKGYATEQLSKGVSSLAQQRQAGGVSYSTASAMLAEWLSNSGAYLHETSPGRINDSAQE
jgi:hypothetical protein